jgi:hypothetical protein
VLRAIVTLDPTRTELAMVLIQVAALRTLRASLRRRGCRSTPATEVLRFPLDVLDTSSPIRCALAPATLLAEPLGTGDPPFGTTVLQILVDAHQSAPSIMAQEDAMTLEERIARPGPKKILALDGGGILGLVSVEVLDRDRGSAATAHGPQQVLSWRTFSTLSPAPAPAR